MVVGDLQRLKPEEFLNDSLMDFYIKYLMVSSCTIHKLQHFLDIMWNVHDCMLGPLEKVQGSLITRGQIDQATRAYILTVIHSG